MSKKKQALLFVNKKKFFAPLGRAGSNATVPKEQKFFAPLFFEKAAAFLSPLKPITL
jgi:hypothetical protein